MSDFMGGDLQVKAVEQNVLLVEGRVGKEEGGKSSTKSFSRRFQLPGVVEVDGITSALSKDGILIITAPKRSLNNSDETSQSGMRKSSIYNHKSDPNHSSISHQGHSSQHSRESSVSRTSTSSHSSSSASQHFTSSPF